MWLFFAPSILARTDAVNFSIENKVWHWKVTEKGNTEIVPDKKTVVKTLKLLLYFHVASSDCLSDKRFGGGAKTLISTSAQQQPVTNICRSVSVIFWYKRFNGHLFLFSSLVVFNAKTQCEVPQQERLRRYLDVLWRHSEVELNEADQPAPKLPAVCDSVSSKKPWNPAVLQDKQAAVGCQTLLRQPPRVKL